MKEVAVILKDLRESDGAGQCTTMAEILNQKYGWEIDSGFYLQPGKMHNGHGDHVWNVLKDGTIIDATHDQFGEPDINVVSPSSPGYKSYHAYCGSFTCPLCTCPVCNPGFADEAKTKTAAEHPVWHDGKFLCPCGGGNSSEEEGFVACDRQGNRIDPVKWNETKYYLCTNCQRIFKKIGKEGENNDGSNDVVIGFGMHKDQPDFDFDLLKKDAAIRTPFGPRELTVHNPKRGMRIRHGATKIPGTIVKVLHGENEGDVEIKWDKTPWNLGRTGIYALWSLEPEGEFTPNLKFEASTT